MKKRYWRDIESDANSLLNWFIKQSSKFTADAPTMPPIPIREICSLRGLSINAVSGLTYDGKKLAGMLDAERRAVSFEAKDILGRQRFSLAHELGHYELHWLPYQASQMTPMLFPPDKFIDETFMRYFRCTSDDMELKESSKDGIDDRERLANRARRRTREIEANQFASFLLMPEDMIRDWAKRFQGDLHRLAYQFEVSSAAMQWRLTNLRMRVREEEARAQNHFFFHLSELQTQPPSHELASDNTDSNRSDNLSTILVTPESRLRTLISEVDVVEQASDKILLDLSPLETSELGAIGPTQALDFALLNDYVLEHIFPIRAIAAENLSLTAGLPTKVSYVTPHLSRLGVFDYLHLGNDHKIASSLPLDSDTATGSHILIRLTKIEAAVDFRAIARGASEHFLHWTGQPEGLKEFADFTEFVVLGLTQNIIEHSGTRPGLGRGYIVAQLDPMVRDDQVTGYQTIIAVGDIGIGLRNSLNQKQSAILDSDFEAIRRYLNGPTMSQLKAAITGDWNGHLQINSGDAMLSVGARSTAHLTGLYRVPGLQLTALIACQL